MFTLIYYRSSKATFSDFSVLEQFCLYILGMAMRMRMPCLSEICAAYIALYPTYRIMRISAWMHIGKYIRMANPNICITFTFYFDQSSTNNDFGMIDHACRHQFLKNSKRFFKFHDNDNEDNDNQDNDIENTDNEDNVTL